MEYNDKIKKEKLQVIINNVDNDGEKLQSERRPKIIVYGSSLSDMTLEIPSISQVIFDTSIFFVLAEFLLYRPSFLFDFSGIKMSLNTARAGRIFQTIAMTSGTCRFARLVNAERVAVPVIQFSMGLLNSTADFRVDDLHVEKDETIKIVSNYFREH